MIDLTLRMTRRNIRSLEDEEETCDVCYYCIISVLRGQIITYPVRWLLFRESDLENIRWAEQIMHRRRQAACET